MGWLDKLFGPSRKVMPEHVEDLDGFRSVVVKSDVPVIVDVWSENCAPCRALGPVLVDVATRYEGRVRVAEVNAAADPRLLRKLDARATPTVIIYHRGREFGRVVGFRPASWFEEMIEKEFPASA